MLRTTFDAMGTRFELLLDAPERRMARRALAAARVEIDRLEALLSRFRPDSDLSRLNRLRRAPISADLERVLRLALQLRRRTGGRFDPTVGRAVAAAGYDRTFASIGAAPERPPAPAGGIVALGDGWAALDEGVEIDLGGIAKGDAADRAAAIVGAVGPCLVNAGGDLAAGGPAREWAVGLECGLTLALPLGGLATSGVDRRRWRRGDGEAHHTMDPSLGAPAPTDLVRVTAAAPSGAEADALATALLVAGAARAEALCAEWRVPAVLVPADGAPILAGGVK
jgi:thiamine biosynthesis lipoprotein